MIVLLRDGREVQIEAHEMRGGYCHSCGSGAATSKYAAIKKVPNPEYERNPERFIYRWNEETVAVFRADDVTGWVMDGVVIYPPRPRSWRVWLRRWLS